MATRSSNRIKVERARRSADLWPGFSARLAEQSDIDLGFRQPGGLQLCLSEAELSASARFLERMHNQIGPGGYEGRLLDRAEFSALGPTLGPEGVVAFELHRD